MDFLSSLNPPVWTVATFGLLHDSSCLERSQGSYRLQAGAVRVRKVLQKIRRKLTEINALKLYLPFRINYK